MIPVCMCFDRSLENHVFHVLRSVMHNSSQAVIFHLLCTEDVTSEAMESFADFGAVVHRIVLPQFQFYRGGMVRSVAMFGRWLIPHLLPDGKAVYLDNDVIVTGDIAEMYNIELGQNLIAAVPDRFAKTAQDTVSHQWPNMPQVFNLNIPSYMSGQLLVNCDAWRAGGVTERLFKFAERQGSLDMITLNLGCAGFIHELGREWCISANYDDVPQNAKLLHWHGVDKPWNKTCKNQEYFDKYAR